MRRQRSLPRPAIRYENFLFYALRRFLVPSFVSNLNIPFPVFNLLDQPLLVFRVRDALVVLGILYLFKVALGILDISGVGELITFYFIEASDGQALCRWPEFEIRNHYAQYHLGVRFSDPLGVGGWARWLVELRRLALGLL